MEQPVIRVLVVDDYQPWHEFVSSTLRRRLDLQVVARAFDGLDAVQKAGELRPDLVILDIGLPRLNGIEAARQIHKLSPGSRILFFSENRSPEIASETLRANGRAYVVKSDAASDLLPAIAAVLQGKRFVSSSLERELILEVEQHRNLAETRIESISANLTSPRHEMALYADDASLVNGFARFITAALSAGQAAIVVATESHQHIILQRLSATLDMRNTIRDGRYIPLDVAETLAMFMSDEMPDPVRFSKAADELIMGTAKATKLLPRQIAACGEGASTLLQQGRAAAAIQLEHLWDEVARLYNIDIFCPYVLNETQRSDNSEALSRIRAEHSIFQAA